MLPTNDDTIAAIATAAGIGAISIIRLSGPLSKEILEKIFSSKRSKLPSHQAVVGHILDPKDNEKIDQVVAIVYTAPNSYTGEDLVEISCHGSPYITNRILSICLDNGARLAKAGEFTQRAFLSGKLDLTQAEAVLDLIQSKTGRQGRLALTALSGELGQQIKEIRLELINLQSRVVAGIDFPEEIGDTPEADIEGITKKCIEKLTVLVSTARSGRFLRDGLRLSIVGRPNAGKSSLLNRLLNFERAIVTDIPGTTRDSLEEVLDLNGIPVILTDTAGIRHTEDIVEQKGIERSLNAIKGADLSLLVIDLCHGFGEAEEQILGHLDGIPFILVANKVDLVDNLKASQACVFTASKEKLAELNKKSETPKVLLDSLVISAKTGEGIDSLKKIVESWVFKGQGQNDHQTTVNQRQAELCQKAIDALNLVLSTNSSGLPQDCLATDLKSAIDCLSEICGEAVSQEIISQVFANFCIGK